MKEPLIRKVAVWGVIVGLAILLPIFIFTRTNPPDTTQMKAQQNSAEVVQVTKPFAPVTGAFGWRLGELLTNSISNIKEIDDGRFSLSFTSGQDSALPPFHVIIMATKDRYIYEISGRIWIQDAEEGLAQPKALLLQLLTEKYHRLPKYDYCFGDDTNTVELKATDLAIELDYLNLPLWNSIVAENEKKREAELEMKQQKLRDSSNF